jgi:F-type H+-transporting ATPase subunit delta
MTLLAKRYAAALFQVAQDKGVVDTVGADLQTLHAALQDPDVRAAVASPDSSPAIRRNVLEKLVAGKHELLGNLVQVVLARRREAMLPDLWPAWRALVMEARNEAEGVVETPHSLTDEDLGRLGQLATRLSGKTVTLSSRIMPDLIGGVRLRVRNELYDGSVKNALEQLQRQLLEAPL